jgi:conjugal transfer pilus assembly protein TraB
MGHLDPDAHNSGEENLFLEPEPLSASIDPDARDKHQKRNENVHDQSMHSNAENQVNREEPGVYDYATPSDISAERNSSIKKVVVIIFIVAMVILILHSFMKASNDIEKEEIRKVSEDAKLPQDLNMTTDSVLWQTAKDAEIQKLQKQLDQLAANNLEKAYGDMNGSQKQNPFQQSQQPVNKQLTEAEIAELIKKELRVNNNPQAGLRPLPPLPSTDKMPNKLKKIAKNDGNGGTLSVDDFLTVPQNSAPIAPPSVASAQNSGAQTLPPALNQGTPPPQSAQQNTVPIPSLSGGNGYQPQKSYVKIVDVAELKTTYGGSITKADAEKKNKKPYYLLPGLAKATLHTGFRAPTLTVGAQNTQPVYMSVDSQVAAPNDASIDIQDCTVLGSSRGNLSTGRAEIRLDELNCALVYKNGKQGRISEKINGWVYGEDGMFGLKGRLVSSEGRILKSAIPISMIQALIGALSQAGSTASTVVSGGALGSVSSTTTAGGMEGLKDGALQGASSGMNKSLSKIVDYYISMLKELNPSIEVLGGRNDLSILFKGGVEMKEQDYEPLNLGKLQGGVK